MIYLTCADQPSGVYQSQVIDVCLHVNRMQKEKLRLVALISIRGFFKQRKSIVTAMPGAIVLPSFPGIRRWKMNLFTLRLLFLFIGKQNCWCRGVFATALALMLKEKGLCNTVVFDGRGAYAAEHLEYLHNEQPLQENMQELEKKCVLQADFRLAVSEALVNYWKISFGYNSHLHCVIPCNLAASHTIAFPDKSFIDELRVKAGYTPNDVVLVYSGSHAEWQSLHLLDDWLLQLLTLQPECKVIVLARPDLNKLAFYNAFDARVKQAWLPPDQVKNYLLMADYGLLVREDTTTNRVASPTKFAEYLASGLHVLISSSIGDLSSFTQSNDCGKVVSLHEKPPQLSPLSYEEKTRNHNLALSYFTKEKHTTSYQKILGILSAS